MTEIKDEIFDFSDDIVEIRGVGFFHHYKNDYISNYIKELGDWEEEFNIIFEKYITKNSIVLDIGAFIGTNTIKMARKAREVHAFEAFRPTFDLLNKNVVINNMSNIKTYNIAIGNEYKIIDKMWFPRTVSIGDHNMINNGAMRINKDDSLINENVLTETKMMRLDDFVFDGCVDLIKIDVEGCEREVLKGGMETLRKHKPKIVIENWEEEPYKELFELGYDYVQINNCNFLYY